jgi:hypothetical protein
MNSSKLHSETERNTVFSILVVFLSFHYLFLFLFPFRFQLHSFIAERQFECSIISGRWSLRLPISSQDLQL